MEVGMKVKSCCVRGAHFENLGSMEEAELAGSRLPPAGVADFPFCEWIFLSVVNCV
jgi:hypothetical protein